MQRTRIMSAAMVAACVALVVAPCAAQDNRPLGPVPTGERTLTGAPSTSSGSGMARTAGSLGAVLAIIFVGAACYRKFASKHQGLAGAIGAGGLLVCGAITLAIARRRRPREEDALGECLRAIAHADELARADEDPGTLRASCAAVAHALRGHLERAADLSVRLGIFRPVPEADRLRHGDGRAGEGSMMSVYVVGSAAAGNVHPGNGTAGLSVDGLNSIRPLEKICRHSPTRFQPAFLAASHPTRSRGSSEGPIKG